MSATDVWAVGQTETGDLHAAVDHWDGSHWRLVAGRQPNGSGSALNAVSAATTDDVWAVGSVYRDGGYASWSEHWDGSTWMLVRTVNPGGVGYLGAVDAVSPSSAWAVGGSNGTPLVEHWDGSQWTVVPCPAPKGGDFSSFTSVSVVSDDDIWAVGSTGGSGFTEHWDGSTWSIVPSPNPGTFLTLSSVKAVATDDVWAVGERDNGGNGYYTFVVQWNGQAWHRRVHPDPGSPHDYRVLSSIDASSGSDVWAVGWFRTDSGLDTVETLHYDGTTWTDVPTRGGRGLSELIGVSVLSPTSAFATGTNYYGGYYLTWDGSQWRFQRGR